MIAEIYTALAGRLDEQVGQLKHIDLYNNGQYKVTPSVFIEFTEIRWTNSSAGIQTGDLLVSFWIVQQIFNDSRHNAAARNRSLALSRFDLLTDTHKALQGFSGPNFGPLSRVQTKLDRDFFNVIFY